MSAETSTGRLIGSGGYVPFHAACMTRNGSQGGKHSLRLLATECERKLSENVPIKAEPQAMIR